MKALILSAGFGTRLRPLTNKYPKPAIPFLGIPIALFAVEYAIQLGATEFIFNTFHLSDVLEKEIKPYLQQRNLDFHFIKEAPQILGSGGGLKNIEKLLEPGEEIVVINGDEIIVNQNKDFLKNFLDKHKQRNANASLLCMPHPEAGKSLGGVWTNESQQIIGFGREVVTSATEVHHFVGLSLYSHEIFNHIEAGVESNILYDGILNMLLKKPNTAYSVSQDLHWYETGNLESYWKAHDDILSNWGSPEYWILESAIKRFAPERIIQDFDSLKTNPTIIGGQNLNQGKDWSIVLNDSVNDVWISQHPKSIVLPTFVPGLGESMAKVYF